MPVLTIILSSDEMYRLELRGLKNVNKLLIFHPNKVQRVTPAVTNNLNKFLYYLPYCSLKWQRTTKMLKFFKIIYD